MSDSIIDMAKEATIADSKSSVGVEELPCGLLLPDGGLHTSVDLVEIDGAAEDLLSSNQIPPYAKIDALIGHCVTRIGPIDSPGEIKNLIPTLPVGDRIWLLIKLRRISLGDAYPFEVECRNPNCVIPDTDPPKRTSSRQTIDLSSIEIRSMPTPRQRTYTVTVHPRNKPPVEAAFHVMTGLDDHRISRLSKADQASLQILARLDRYDTRKIDWGPKDRNAQELIAFAKGLGLSVRNELRDAYEAVEGGVDTGVEIHCPFCGMDFETELVLDDGFFRPSVASKSSKRT